MSHKNRMENGIQADKVNNPHHGRLMLEHGIACITGIVSAFVFGMAIFGWSIQNHGLDFFPRLTASLGIWLSIRSTTRLARGWTTFYGFLAIAIQLAIEKVISWNLLTLLDQEPGRPTYGLKQLCYEGIVGDTNQFGLAHWIILLFSLGSPWIAYPFFVWLNEWKPPVVLQSAIDRIRNRLGLVKLDDSTHPSLDGCTVDYRGLVVPGLLWLFLMFVLAWVRPAGSEAFRLMTFPSDRVSSINPVLGYSVLVDQIPIMSETLAAHEQTARFCGLEIQDENFRYARAGYAFLASHLVLFFSIENALLAVNLLSWLLCVACVAWLSNQVFCSRLASALSGCMACVGIGPHVHVDSTTPHLLSFAIFSILICIFVAWRLNEREWSFHRHLAIGFVLGWASCCYNVAQILLAIYLLNGIWVQRWRHLLASTLIAFSFRPIWTNFLCAFGNTVSGTETEYATAAILEWWRYCTVSPLELLKMLMWHSSSIVSSLESPWLLVVTIIAWFRLPIALSHRWLMGSSWVAALSACLYFAPVAEARGYIVYGSCWTIFLLVGSSIAKSILCAKNRTNRTLVYIAACTLFASQFLWVTAHWNGYLGPIKMYYLGWEHAMATMAPLKTTIMQNGSAEWHSNSELIRAPQTGLPILASVETVENYVGLRAVFYRLPLAFGLLIVACQFRTSLKLRSLFWIVFFCSLALGAEVSNWQRLMIPKATPIDRTIEMAAHEKIIYEMDISESQANGLSAILASEENQLRIYASVPNGVNLQCSLGARLVASESHGGEWIPESSIGALEACRTVIITLENETDQEKRLAGWQQPSAKRRVRSSVDEASKTRIAPSVEIRVRRTDSSLVFVLY